MFSTRMGYFSIILDAIRRESFRLTIVRFPICSGVASKMTLRSFRDLEGIRYHLKLLLARLYRARVNGSRVT